MTDTSRKRQSLEREVHVWLARPSAVVDSVALARCRDMLDEAEESRMQRFLTEPLQRLFLVSHALVRTTLSRYVDLPPAAWRFAIGEFGKPEIAPRLAAPGLRFNLSHTEGLAACVVCHEWDCGVDVERVGRVEDVSAIARRVFSSSEREALEALPDGSVRQGRFTDYWVLKEAYIKARGTGFQLAPRRFGIELSNAPEIGIRFGADMGDQDPSAWQLALHEIEPGLRLGVALARGSSPPRRLQVREAIPGC